MKNIHLLVAITLMSCVRSPSSQALPLGDDKSIGFPDFFQRDAVTVGAPDRAYVLDGVTLRALMIASHDFFPSDSGDRPCWERQEAHNYRIIHQGNIIFIHIDVDPERCGRRFLTFDSGVKYAISTEGRILRRVFDGEPEQPPSPVAPDAGGQELTDEPGLSTILKSPMDDPSRYLPPEWLDGGAKADGGSSAALDGGS